MLAQTPSWRRPDPLSGPNASGVPPCRTAQDAKRALAQLSPLGHVDSAASTTRTTSRQPRLTRDAVPGASTNTAVALGSDWKLGMARLRSTDDILTYADTQLPASYQQYPNGFQAAFQDRIYCLKIMCLRDYIRSSRGKNITKHSQCFTSPADYISLNQIARRD